LGITVCSIIEWQIGDGVYCIDNILLSKYA